MFSIYGFKNTSLIRIVTGLLVPQQYSSHLIWKSLKEEGKKHFMAWLIILHFGVCDSITTLLILNATKIHLYSEVKPQKNGCMFNLF